MIDSIERVRKGRPAAAPTLSDLRFVERMALRIADMPPARAKLPAAGWRSGPAQPPTSVSSQ